VIGGCRDNYELIGDIHRVDLKALFEAEKTTGFVWERMIEADKNLERWGHTCEVYNHKIYVFAGRVSQTTDANDILAFDAATNTLKQMKVKDKNAPKPRRRHASLMVGSSLLCFGGYNGKYLNDFSFITLNN
jgi:N-acetylneuraminic acid mutarotase